MKYWPHQDRIHQACQLKWVEGSKRWCVVAPCGSGKTLMMMRIIEGALERGLRVAVYSVRIQNTAQLMDVFEDAGIRFGSVAAAFKSREDFCASVQVCQLQTVARKSGAVPEADIVFVDEAHQQTSKQAQEVFGAHSKAGARIIGWTATPVNLGGMYDDLVIGPKYQELIDCRAHLPCKVFVPEIPACVARNDRDVLKIQSSGEISAQIDAMINDVESIYGNVIKEWRRLNPFQLPAVLFAPDVKSAVGYVHKFRQAGVQTASVDGERVVMCRDDLSGVEEMDSSVEARREVLDGSRDGRFKVVHNRFVLRESVDMPWLYQAIVCSTMTGLSTYLQSVGRVLRYWEGYDHVLVQDHSGSTDRHGFPFVDRVWGLGDTNTTMAKKEKERRQRTKGDEAEPVVCPKCGAARLAGKKCYECGHIHTRSVRRIRELDGTLVERKVGRLVKPKREKSFDDYLISMLHQFKNSHTGRGTVKQAYHLARKKALIDGVKVTEPKRVNLPKSERDWGLSVKQWYKNERITRRGGE